ncbi:hypothetical protein EDF20_0199 [Frigoribacterium sp. PhB116]|nr:hypothetical protein EDF20_0199 [Frigoribacterium sp. PhB116]
MGGICRCGPGCSRAVPDPWRAPTRPQSRRGRCDAPCALSVPGCRPRDPVAAQASRLAARGSSSPRGDFVIPPSPERVMSAGRCRSRRVGADPPRTTMTGRSSRARQLSRGRELIRPQESGVHRGSGLGASPPLLTGQHRVNGGHENPSRGTGAHRRASGPYRRAWRCRWVGPGAVLARRASRARRRGRAWQVVVAPDGSPRTHRGPGTPPMRECEPAEACARVTGVGALCAGLAEELAGCRASRRVSAYPPETTGARRDHGNPPRSTGTRRSVQAVRDARVSTLESLTTRGRSARAGLLAAAPLGRAASTGSCREALSSGWHGQRRSAAGEVAPACGEEGRTAEGPTAGAVGPSGWCRWVSARRGAKPRSPSA